MKKRSSGFSLIELIITVAIIGILTSIALPAYQTYVAKSILTSLHSSASAGRSGVLSRYMNIGEMPDVGSGINGIINPNSITIGLDNALKESPYQSSVLYTKHKATKASFLVTLDHVNSNINGKTLSFIYEDIGGSLSLRCVAHPEINKKYIPLYCQ